MALRLCITQARSLSLTLPYLSLCNGSLQLVGLYSCFKHGRCVFDMERPVSAPPSSYTSSSAKKCPVASEYVRPCTAQCSAAQHMTAVCLCRFLVCMHVSQHMHCSCVWSTLLAGHANTACNPHAYLVLAVLAQIPHQQVARVSELKLFINSPCTSHARASTRQLACTSRPQCWLQGSVLPTISQLSIAWTKFKPLACSTVACTDCAVHIDASGTLVHLLTKGMEVVKDNPQPVLCDCHPTRLKPVTAHATCSVIHATRASQKQGISLLHAAAALVIGQSLAHVQWEQFACCRCGIKPWLLLLHTSGARP